MPCVHMCFGMHAASGFDFLLILLGPFPGDDDITKSSVLSVSWSSLDCNYRELRSVESREKAAE